MPHDPRALDNGRASWTHNSALYHIAIPEAVGRSRLCIDGGGGRQERESQLVGIFGGEAERGREDPRLVFATRVLRVQSVSCELLQINDSGIAAGHFHYTSCVCAL